MSILEEPSKSYDVNKRLDNNWKQIKIGPVHFSYGKDSMAIRNMNIQLNRGEKIAFIGESGAGKSTLMKLLNGLIECDNYGEVLIDNKPSRITYIQNEIAYIPQESEVFENTIAYNIGMGTASSKEELLEFSKIACFDSVVYKLPNTYDTDIRENGVNLSGGEKQRLALARGLFAVKNKSIIF